MEIQIVIIINKQIETGSVNIIYSKTGMTQISRYIINCKKDTKKCIAYLSVLLDPDSCSIAWWMSIHRSYYGCNGRLLIITRWWMSYISTQEDHRLIEHFWSETRTNTLNFLNTTIVNSLQTHHSCNKEYMFVKEKIQDFQVKHHRLLFNHNTLPDAWNKNGVDASQLHIYFETEVGQCLRWGFVHILGLDTLGSHS